MKKLIFLALLVAPNAWGACHAVGPSATGAGTGADFSNLMAMPISNGWVRGDTYYLIAGTYPNKLQFGPTVSGTTVVHIWRATNADHGQGCGIGAGYNDATMGQPAGPANLKLFEGLTSYLDLDGKYHPTPWQTNGGGLNVQTGYGFYINGNTACGPGACWEMNISNGLGNTNYTIKNVGIYGRGDANTDANCPSCNVDSLIRFVGGGGTHAFQYIGMFNSSNVCVQAWNTDNWSFDHIWCEHNHATTMNHAEPFSMSGGSHNKITNSVFKDIEGTGAFVQLSVGGVGQTADDYEIAGNVIFVQPLNPTGRSGFGNGVISCINNNSWTNLVFANNTIAFLPGFSRFYMLTGTDNCSSQTGLIAKDNIWYLNSFSGSANHAVASLTPFDYNSYLQTTTNDPGANSTILPSGANPFVASAPAIASDFFLTSNTNVTPWLNICAIAPDTCPDGVGTARSLSRGAFESTTPGTAPMLILSPSPAAFGNQPVSTTSAPLTITVSNTGTAAETLSTPYFTITTGNSGDFNNTGGSCSNGAVIAVGGRCTWIGNFVPSIVGAESSLLTIQGTVNATDSLTGTGTVAPIPVVTLGPRVVNFGTINTGSSSGNQAFTLTNTGTATLNITSILSSSVAFPLNSITCGATLAASASCGFNATFAPSVAGVQTATITLISNAASSPDTISLTGTGFTPAISPPPAPAPVIFTQLALPLQPVISNVSASSTCAINNRCTYTLNCTQCSPSTLLFIDGSQFTQSYANGVMTYTAKLSAGTHNLLAVNLF